MKKLLLAICSMAIAIPAYADITITDTTLAGLTYTTSGAGASSTFVSSAGGDYALITSPDNVGGGGLNQFHDTGEVIVMDGYDGADLGTLNTLVAAGAAGHVSFDNAVEGGNNGNFAYWGIDLIDPNNSSNNIEISAYSDATTGLNSFNEGVVGSSSTNASVSDPMGLFPFGSTWADVENVIDDGTNLGSWDVALVAIAVGGWNTGVESSAQITSITLPGNNPGVVAPEPATWAALLVGVVVLVAFRRRFSFGK